MTQGVIDLLYASESGDPFAISVASVGIFQGFLGMAGPMLGPAGPLVSALSGMLATILAQWLPTPPSVKEEIEEVFNTFQAQEKEFALGSVDDQISVFIHTLELKDKRTKKPIPAPWEPLNLLDGEQVKAIDAAWQWLSKPQKQSLPYWGDLLSKTCEAFTQLLRAVTVGVAFPSEIKAVYKWKDEEGVTHKVTPSELMNVHLQSRCEKFLQKLRRIKPVVQNRGMVFHLSTKGGELWAGDQIEEGTNNARLGGTSTTVSVAVSQKEMWSEDPVYHLLRLRDYPAAGSIWYRKLSSPYNGPSLDGDDLALSGSSGSGFTMAVGPRPKKTELSEILDHSELTGLSDVWGMVGGDHRLDTSPPPGIGKEKGRDRIYFYTATNKNVINGYVRDKSGVLTKIYGRGVSGPALKWVRVVQGPKAVAGDPDDKIGSTELPGILRNIDYVVYGGCQSVWNGPDGVSPRGDYIYVDSRRSPRGKDRILKEGFVRGPWGGTYYYGLGVDQSHVWVHAPLGFACATHASVMCCLEGNLKEPTWMFHYMGSHPQHRNDTDPKEGKIVDLCPSDDGSLVVSLTEGDAASAAASTDGAPLYTAAYHVNLKTRHIAVQRWTRTGGGAAAYRSCKVPLFCWPQLEGLIEFVEETYPDHAAQAHTH